MSTVELVGRTDELGALGQVLDLAGEGLSGVLVVSGEAGIGKTALLERVAASAPGRITRVAGIESEMELSYAALHHILLPFAAEIPGLPPPQRAALEGAFGIEAGPTPNRFLVGLATLTLLADAAGESSLLCVIDDAQWIDQESADALTFVARRLNVDGIAMVFGVRDSGSSTRFAGLPKLELRGLPEETALQLLGSAVGGPIDDRIGQRLVETGANPLALLELADQLTAEQLTGEASLPDPLPIGGRLQQAFSVRVGALPERTQTLLLVAAADSSLDPALMWRAAARLGLDAADADVAEAERLLVLTPEVRFRHPMIRSAVYQRARPEERRRVHQALAAASDEDAERRVWHLAAATVGPDEGIAVELEQSAARVFARGGSAAAARLLTRAVELTEDEDRKSGRRLAAAGAALVAGNAGSAEAILASASARLETPFEHAMGLRLRGAVRFAQGEAGEPLALLLQAARAFEPLDARLSHDTFYEAFEVATWTSPDAAVEVAREVLASPRPADVPPTTLDLLLDAFTVRMLEGHAAAIPLYRDAIAALMVEDGDLRGFILGSIAASDYWDLDAADVLTNRWVALARAQGALAILPLALTIRMAVEFLSGRLASARAISMEALELSRATTEMLGEAGHGEELLLAWTGPEADARAAVAAHHREALARGQGTHGALVPELALSQLELGLGNFPAAHTSAARVFAADFVGAVSAWNLADMVEASVRSGQAADAARALARLEAHARASPTPTALGHLARSQALLAHDEHAEPLFHEAIEHLEHSPAVPDLARAHLLYGEWLRAHGRTGDARDSLRRAHEMFDTMGATFFAQRARTELAATGERARPRASSERGDLTAQELQVAQLAATGATNREIGAQLFIAASTVDYHLRKVFRKLNVTARTQLRDELDATPSSVLTDR